MMADQVNYISFLRCGFCKGDVVSRSSVVQGRLGRQAANSWLICVAVCIFLSFAVPVWAQPVADAPGLKQQPALVLAGAAKAMMLGAVRAGERIVSVGDHGVVLLSDDGGQTYRQAKSVPTRATLSAVHFVGDKDGWAVGHWGVVLHTVDGGETWTLQRNDLTADRPLFSVWFQDREVGLAVGLWGLILRTTDGGVNWQEVPLPPATGKAKASDKNLLAIFPDGKGHIFLAAERGTIFKSVDGGLNWLEINTGNFGTFWAGLTLKGGALLLAGLRGRIFRSTDEGMHWTEVNSGTKSSITAMAQLSDGRVLAVGLDGVSLESNDEGLSFSVATRQDRLPLTVVLGNSRGQPVVFSMNGPVLAK